jgi:Zn-dependent peptidase ImmA (M78 family)
MNLINKFKTLSIEFLSKYNANNLFAKNKSAKIPSRLRKKYNLNILPVNIFLLADYLHISIIPQSFADIFEEISGFVDINENKIFIDNNLKFVDRVFIISILIGHLILHKEELKANPDLGIIRKQIDYNAYENEYSQSAKLFAIALLIPKEYKKYFKNKSTSELSALFTLPESILVNKQLISI